MILAAVACWVLIMLLAVWVADRYIRAKSGPHNSH
jgi:hypothetical protein